MKTTHLIASLALLGGSAAIAADEADKSSETTDAKITVESAQIMPSISKIIADGASYNTLEKALVATGLDKTLDGATEYTLFAPTDEAFAELGEETLNKLMMPEHKEKLRSFLLYHVIQGKRAAVSFNDGTDVKSLNGDLLEIDLDDGQVKVEDSSDVVNADLNASNGVVHVIDKVLVPESLDGFGELDED